MTFNAERMMKRYDPEEQAAILDYLLEMAAPKDIKTKVPLITLAETWDDALKLKGDADGVGGLSTGYSNIDDMTGGLREGQLIIIFGDTGHGKSMLTQNITANVAKSGVPVLYIGLEMTNAENTERLQGMGADAALPVLYPAQIDLDVKHVQDNILAALDAGIKLVVVDHLHMFEGLTEDNEAQFLTSVCREMKMLAIKYKLPIILVSHIKERPPGQERHVPQLWHLKGSSSIKQLADSALAVHNESMVSDFDTPNPELIIIQRKSRRGRQQRRATLRIMSDARLVEPIATQFSGATASRAIEPAEAEQDVLL